MSHGIKPDVPRGNPQHYIAFDPGEGTGWATFSENGMPTNYGNVYNDATGLYELLHGNSPVNADSLPRVVIYEKWVLRKAKEMFGSTIPSLQSVGVIRGWATHIGAKIISQEPLLNQGNEKESGLKPEGPHSTQHWVLAFNHGWHYLTAEKIVVPRILWPEG